jgi:Fe-S-cluster containining protein
MGINRDPNSTMKWIINRSVQEPRVRESAKQPGAGQGGPQTLEQRLARELGQDYFTRTPPPVIEYDTEKLARRARNDNLFRQLLKIYGRLPEVTCGDCGHVCCSDSPDMYLIEYLHVWRHIRYEMQDPDAEARILGRALQWAFLKFVAEDIFCPFLEEGRCAIYPVRPLNCRVWALEDEAYYLAKAERARESVKKQQEYFERHGVRLLKPLKEFILPRCRNIRIHGRDAHLTEEEIREIDIETAFLHKALVRPEEFRSINFHLHFPGIVALKRIPAGEFDEARIAIALEYQAGGASARLDALAQKYGGRLP